MSYESDTTRTPQPTGLGTAVLNHDPLCLKVCTERITFDLFKNADYCKPGDDLISEEAIACINSSRLWANWWTRLSSIASSIEHMYVQYTGAPHSAAVPD